MKRELRSAFVLLTLLLGVPVGVGAQERLTQRGINEYAASLERARFALVEETGLRLSGEPFAAYLSRIAQPLPGEAGAAYRGRMASYIRALSLASEATAPLRQMPSLQNTGERNRRVWQQATRSIRLLPARTRKLGAVWLSFAMKSAKNSAENAAIKSVNKFTIKNAQATRALSAELVQTLDLVLAAFAALRDAVP